MNQRIGDAPKLGLWGRIKRIVTTDVGALVRGLNAADLEAMERILLEADFGVPATIDLTEAIEIRSGKALSRPRRISAEHSRRASRGCSRGRPIPSRSRGEREPGPRSSSSSA